MNLFENTPPAPKSTSNVRAARLISALGTPLDDEENLHVEGLERHLEEQWANGVRSTFVGGTMGLLPLLRETTYHALVEKSAAFCRDRIELLVGVGDTGLARTCDRIDWANRFEVDGVVAITPYFLPFSQAELIDYFHRLADRSRNPLYVYDIPARTGVALELETALRLAEHPNIHGIKCTRDLDWTEELFARVDSEFCVIAVALGRMVSCFQKGMTQHVDGLFALMPSWTGQITRAAEAVDWETVQSYEKRFCHLLDVVRRHGSFATYTEIVRLRGIPGNYAPGPLRRLEEAAIETIRNDPVLWDIPSK